MPTEEIIVSPGGPSDHPLNNSPDSTWSTYFKDNEVLLQIDKDVRRLCPEIAFFQTATEFPCEEVRYNVDCHCKIDTTMVNI